MNETVPTSARALGSVRHPALGPKKRPTTHKSVTRGVQSALEGHTWTLNMEPTGETRKRLNVTDVTYDPFSKSSSANSVSAKHRNGELRWSHRNNLSTSYDKTSINPAINVITGLQFRAINGNRNSCDEDASEAQRSSDRRKKTVTDVAEQGHMERGRSFVKLNRQTLKQWPPKHNYLEDGDYVKGKGHRIDTGPMSRPVSGWLNRESRNAVELAERDKGEGVLGRYYSLDVDTGAVTARQLTNGESILIGVNGKERKKQMNGRGAEEEEEEEEEEAEERDAEAEDSEVVNGESEETQSSFVPLCWNDQFMKPKVKVVKPRLPSAQPSSASVNETKPVVFWTSGSQRDVPPLSVTMLQTPTKENYVSTALQKKSGQTLKKKQQSVKFDEFLHRSVRGAIDSTISDGEENLESFRHKSLDSGGTWSASYFPIPGSGDPGKTNLQLVNGRQGDSHADMIVVGSSQISSKTSENEKPVIRGGGGGGAAGEKHPSIHHRRGSGPGSRESGDATPREVSIINIVQPIRMKGESDENSDTTEAKKTSARKNDSAVRLRYSVRNPRASTGLRRGPPEGLCKKSPVMVRSASVREGRLAAISRENSSYDWNLNCINIKPALHGEAPKDHAQSNKTGEWSNEDARRSGSQTGGREREAVGNSDLSQPFDVVQLSPIRVKTASLQTRSTHLLENPYTETNNAALGDQSEISFAPPPSRAATPNARRSSAKGVSTHEGEPSSRRGTVTHHVPSAAKSQVSECEDLERSPEIEEESLRRELFDGEDAERSSEALEQRQTSELQFESEEGDMESVSAEEEQIERRSPFV